MIEEIQTKIEAARASAEYRTYLRVREQVSRILEAIAGDGAQTVRPSAYWEEELANFEYMFDASPLIIQKLRHHCYHITGLRVYDYRSNRDKAAQAFQRKLEMLKELGWPELLVPESPLLGGFGFEIDHQLYNVDTLKFYEVLIALEKGAVLREFRHAEQRRLVWEIGAGWGGFAYQFKTLFPNVTYVITDFPELFLFSAVYLITLFPEARVRFHHPNEPWPAEELLDFDFVFVSNRQLPAMKLPGLSLTVNMVSFQEMTTDQVRAYVQTAHEQGSLFLYSLNRDRSPYNTELTSVPSVLTERYWIHEIPVLDMPYTRMPDDAKATPKRGAAPTDRPIQALGRKLTGTAKQDKDIAGSYKHIVGWKKLQI